MSMPLFFSESTGEELRPMGWKIRGSVGALIALATVLAFAPAAAQAEIEQGNPEVLSSGSLLTTQPVGVMTWGQVDWTSPVFPSGGIECAFTGIGTQWNAESPTRGEGQVLAFDGGGHVPEGSHTELQSQCGPHNEPTVPGTFITTQVPLKEQDNSSHEVVVTDRKLTTPWDEELKCGVRNRKYAALVTVGVPASEFPRGGSSCPPAATTAEETKEIESYKRELERKEGCYASVPAPVGCVRITLVEPGAGLEFPFGGTWHEHWLDGSKNGLTPSKLRFEGTGSGDLQCEITGCTMTGTWTGEIREAGYDGLQLMQVR